METTILKSIVQLSKDEILTILDLSKEDVREVLKADYYNYDLTVGKTYDYTIYEVKTVKNK